MSGILQRHSYQCDALGRRVAATVHPSGQSATTTVFVLDGQRVIADYASGALPSAPSARYVYASYIDEPVAKISGSGQTETLVCYSRNQQFSITALTDDSGAVVERYSYTAYGSLAIHAPDGTACSATAHTNRYTYTGR